MRAAWWLSPVATWGESRCQDARLPPGLTLELQVRRFDSSASSHENSAAAAIQSMARGMGEPSYMTPRLPDGRTSQAQSSISKLHVSAGATTLLPGGHAQQGSCKPLRHGQRSRARKNLAPSGIPGQQYHCSNATYVSYRIWRPWSIIHCHHHMREQCGIVCHGEAKYEINQFQKAGKPRCR